MPPCPRYQHSMVHMPKLNLLVVHGGRTSQNVKTKKFFNPSTKSIKSPSALSTPKKGFTLGDIYALKLDSLEWIKIIYPYEENLARSNHCMARISNDSLIIFGGNAINSTYCSSDYIITLTDEDQSLRTSIQSAFGN
mmetsp:Transcript_22142/g.19686  ORF Transcript_22142/g.19686 Transcript_22142/m.19686 type:complete len:137 (-) Transcript_22142:4-414(-)